MAKEYIEREAIYKRLNNNKKWADSPSTMDYAAELVLTVPTADVVEVKHGKWKINSDGYYPYCSECNNEPENGKLTKYCPNCGAKMDKE